MSRFAQMVSERPLGLLVASHVEHHCFEGQVHAYGPYARELALWCRTFGTVTIVGPRRDGPPPADAAPIDGDVRVIHLDPGGGPGWAPKLRQAARAPGQLVRLARLARRADALHVRCPGSVGLLGILVGRVAPRRVAKYAGQWTGFPGEPALWRVQRSLLRSRWWGAPVTAYQRRADDPAWVEQFFSAAATDEQLGVAASVAAARAPRPEVRALFVGRLTNAKHPEAAVRAVATARRAGLAITLEVIGDGPLRAALEAEVDGLELGDAIALRGPLPFDEVLAAYAGADVLLLPSESEGWPKAVTEAMAFGLVCIATDTGLIPEILGDGRGWTVPAGDVDALVDRLRSVAADPAGRSAMGVLASTWAVGRSLEALEGALVALLERSWPGWTPPGTAPRRVAVLHLVDTLAVGGAERVATELVAHLPRDRFAPHLCTTRADGPLEALVPPDVGRLRLERRHRLELGALRALRRYVRTHRIEVLHAHSTSLLVALAAFPLRGPVLVWHDHFGGAGRRASPLLRLLARRITRVVAASERNARWAVEELGLPADRVQVLANTSWLSISGGAAPDLPGTDGERIVCVANLRHQKGHDVLLDAMAEVHRTHPSLVLLLLGAASEPSVAERVGSRLAAADLDGCVHLLGSRLDVGDVLAASDIGVLASRSEATPLAVVEYGMAGLPVVATDVGGVGDLLDHGRAGILVPPGDAGALAHELLALVEDPARRARLGAALHAHLAPRWSPEAVLAALVATYDEVLSS